MSFYTQLAAYLQGCPALAAGVGLGAGDAVPCNYILPQKHACSYDIAGGETHRETMRLVLQRVALENAEKAAAVNALCSVGEWLQTEAQGTLPVFENAVVQAMTLRDGSIITMDDSGCITVCGTLETEYTKG